ncbi:MAG: hypothetical protein DSM106950_25130 [Stigonema ocellatum SAG 48.90 = DSM 106950]|nr:hypothetical protein [Stigonema ocellatum SAG 48.90 = DSM 106950]
MGDWQKKSHKYSKTWFALFGSTYLLLSRLKNTYLTNRQDAFAQRLPLGEGRQEEEEEEDR